ncbi:hypothetical protein NC652_032574 [Populus alba x Populus x berolinensis]|nr:hypothetical protein NC652_032574 [Populus alba x Populus x berolinensis]
METTDNEMTKPESDGGSRTESQRIDSLNSESLPSSSPISRCIEEQPSGKVETEGAGSFKKPTLSDKLRELAQDKLLMAWWQVVSDKGRRVACVAASDG